MTTTITPEGSARKLLAEHFRAREAGDDAGIRSSVRDMARAVQEDQFARARAAISGAAARLTPEADDATIMAALADAWNRLPLEARSAALIAEDPGRALEPLPGEDWDACDPPARQWLIHDMLPTGRLAALYGSGGAGKSTLALQIAAAVMYGGSPLHPVPGIRDPDALRADHAVLQPVADEGRVLWLSWEDERNEMLRRWRMAHHAGAIVEPFPSPNLLRFVDMRAIGGPLWGPLEGGHVSTRATWTEAGRRFLHTLPGHKLAILDPLAAAFASSEIDRSLVRAFTSAIDAAAEAAGCTVLLIAHPSQAGQAKGGYSGSTDWQASVRAFLSLEVSGETGCQFAADAKTVKAPAHRLRSPKQSYAFGGGHLWLARHWQRADPEHACPAELAWFGCRPLDAAETHERHAAQATGRKPRSVLVPESSRTDIGANRQRAGNGLGDDLDRPSGSPPYRSPYV